MPEKRSEDGLRPALGATTVGQVAKALREEAEVQDRGARLQDPGWLRDLASRLDGRSE